MIAMTTNNRLKSTLKGKITRLKTYIETVKTETDIVQLKVKLKNVTFLQKNIEELRGNYYTIPNVKEAEIVTIDEELNQMDERLEKLDKKSEFDGLGRRKKKSQGATKYRKSGCQKDAAKISKYFEGFNEDDQMFLVGKGMRQKEVISNVWFDDVQFVPENSSERCIFFAL
ncbi:hypothetical protein AVEN_119762-1 [Araneus ventricosus]|uniref:Uncharacterized protein n=1 Tax=Araneus ventricosus TaxID=182803 RepID=A0A4Y2FCX3_ARAVE|nr:hypothetical protein AVEN_119762-1 [Araneus ventricosus]